MKNYLKYGVSTIAVVTAVGFAQAQTHEGQGGRAGGATMSEQQGGGPSGAGRGTSQMETQGSRHGAQNGVSSGYRQQGGQNQVQGTQEEERGQRPKNRNTTAQENRRGGSQGMEAQESGQGKNHARSTRESGPGDQGNALGQAQRNERGAENRGENANQGEVRTQQGGGAGQKARANIRVTPEEKTRIQNVIVKDSAIRKYSRSNIHFSLNVGTRIPETVVLYSPPPEVISIDPAFRGYKIIVVDDIILVVDPATREIVDIIEV